MPMRSCVPASKNTCALGPESYRSTMQFRVGNRPKSTSPIHAGTASIYTRCLRRRINHNLADPSFPPYTIGVRLFLPLLLVFAPLSAQSPTPRSTLERLKPERLEAVQQQRLEWVKNRAAAQPFGVYQDFR